MRLIIVNDRSFFEPDRSGDSHDDDSGSGDSRGAVFPHGLATALTRDDFPDKLFVSSARGPAQRALADRGTVDFDAGDRRFRVRMVASPEAAYRAFYDVAANDLLWLVHHGRWQHEVGSAEVDAYRAGYRVVNQRIARAVAEEVEATGDRVRVLWQDYQLYLAPAMARRMLAPATMDTVVFQHFVHVPFPEPDQWARLTAGIGAELLRGLLGNDVIGFHLPVYGQRFLDCCHRFLGLRVDQDAQVVHLPDGRVVKVASYPIPATPDHVTETACRPETRELAAALRRRAGDRALIYRTERVDPVKAFPEAMRAYELLLRRPGMAGHVVYLAQLMPARESIPRFAAERERDERMAREVNERHGTASWQPVELVFGHDFPRAVAGYLAYDVLDIVPWADGMNLVALEGPLVTTRDGALVLSTTAGAHEFLRPHAISVPPGDAGRHADALHAALTMPLAERARRAAALRAIAAQGDPTAWLTRQLNGAGS
jgi:trehalose 6-phosphate synthase